MNRRKWLKASALLTGGLPLLPGTLSSLTAAAAPRESGAAYSEGLSDTAYFETAPPEIKARLSANENPFGPSDKAKKAIAESLSTSYQYPFMYTRQLEGKITQFEGLQNGMVMTAAGSSPLLLAAALFYSKSGGTIITGDPSYDDLPSHAKAVGAKLVKVPLTPDFKLDLDAMEKTIDSSTTLIYICNPNNPTGTVLDTSKLKAFCERVSKKVPVFIDEAYIDYMPDPQETTLIEGVKKGQNLIVARTFSKLYGFAGLRVGYIVSQPNILKNLRDYTAGSMSISAPSIRAALAAYQDKDFMQDALRKTFASREFLYKTLQEEGYQAIPSAANFVMFPLRMEGQRFIQEMQNKGVSVRQWKFVGKDWCRVSIGRMDEMQAFADAFRTLS
ncbi:MAG: histidinol-phosphate aminotransferase family protein [Williamsia sp.]|nr:histidinol-phosphate aminotransferase family protein [Williamsia sp.]